MPLPPLDAKVEQVLDTGLDAPRIDLVAIAAGKHAQGDKPRGELPHERPVRIVGVQGATDGLQELAGALDHGLFGDCLVVPEEVAHHAVDDFDDQHAAEVQGADQLHVGEELVLTPLHLELQLFRRVALPLLLRGLEGLRRIFELRLAHVQQHALEGLRPFALGLRRQLGVPAAQGEKHVDVGLATLRVGQSAVDEDADDSAHLCGMQLHLLQAADGGLHAVGTDLVEQRVDAVP
mmetsp:Transcript_120311/g.236432  ORF Transcript_120311/g.236432 Transcript_120311/m.236432 type:complete len:235 (-) Transcript_120311:237-941(-)